jgi:hypothetical protein
LHAIRQAVGKVCDEMPSRGSIPLANRPARNELCVGIDCRPCPNITADTVSLNFFKGDLFLLAANKRPALVNLNPLAVQVAERPILILRTGRAKLHEQFVDGVPGDTGNSGRSTHRNAIHQASNYVGAFSCAKLVHIEHFT